jgi:hypothetical protein
MSNNFVVGDFVSCGGCGCNVSIDAAGKMCLQAGGGGGGIIIDGAGCCSTLRCGVNNLVCECYGASLSGCNNQITIQFEINNKIYYLQYCGITKPTVSDKQSLQKGTLLGTTTEDVTSTLYNSRWNREEINMDIEKTKEKEELVLFPIPKKKEKDTDKIKKQKDYDLDDDNDDNDDSDYKKKREKDVYKKEVRTKNPIAAGVIDLLTYPFTDKYDKEGKRIQKRGFVYPTEKKEKQPDPFIKDFFKKYSVTSPKKEKKINEEIEKIKKLMK